jgi:aspartyl-tRNA(Asn)/glutamyl-tRNA(Gln) amidotransferase subunit B
MSELLKELNRDPRDIRDCPVPPEHLAELLKLIASGVISGKMAKSVFEDMYATRKSPAAIVEEKGLKQVTDETAVEAVILEVLEENPAEVEAYRGGKDKLMGFFVGQVMKKTRGKANPQRVNELLRKLL